MVTYVTDLFDKLETARQKAVQTREVSAILNHILSMHLQRMSLLVARRLRAGEAQSETQNELDLKSKIRGEMDNLQRKASESPKNKEGVEKILRLFGEVDEGFSQAAAQYNAGNTIQSGLIWNDYQGKMAEIIRSVNIMTEDQQREHKINQSAYVEYDSQLRPALSFMLFSSVGLAFVLALFFNYSTTTRLNKLMSNTRLLAAGKQPKYLIGGNDELGQIDDMYHRMSQDLAALRERERAILDNAAEAICSLDADLKLTEFNSAAARLWDLNSDELIGSRLLEHVHADDRARVVDALESAETTGSEVRFECGIVTGSGARLETGWSATWSPNERSLYCVVSDISARKELDRLKQEFVAMLSHDLRTPLNSVMASLEIVNSEHFQLAPDVKQYISKAEKNLTLALSLINQLLEIEKMESGVITLDLDGVMSEEIYQKGFIAVSALADAKKVSIRHAGANVDFVGDLDRLTQVIINLLGNALKFSDAGTKITVRDELRTDAQGREIVRISVIDQGRGIPPEQVARVFDRFQQVNPHDAREKAGSGLGLAICKAIVEAHKGKIGVTSDVGIGSTFWFEIPRGF